MAQKQFFGLDIGSSSIKVTYLHNEKKKYTLLAYGMAPTPGNGMLSEADFDKDALVEIIKRLVRETKIDTPYVCISLPESQVFTRVIEIPPVSEKEVAQAINFEAEQYIPRPLNEVSLKWQIISKGDKASNTNTQVLLVAAPLAIINKYVDIMQRCNLKPIALETDILAQSRAIVGNNPYSPTTLIASIGHLSTDISVIKSGAVYFTRVIGTGGKTLSKSIMSDFSLSFEQAEQYKKTYGMLEDQFEGKVLQSIKPHIELIFGEIKRALEYYTSKNSNDPIKRVVITGGTAKLPGLLLYSANALGTEVQIGDPWFNITKEEKVAVQLSEDSAYYPVSVGLALKEV